MKELLHKSTLEEMGLGAKFLYEKLRLVEKDLLELKEEVDKYVREGR